MVQIITNGDFKVLKGLDKSAVKTKSVDLVPDNNRVAVIGDSIAYGNGFAASANNVKLYAKGYINWAAFLGRQRWRFNNDRNFGVAGDTTAEVLARLPAALAASDAAVWVVDCLTNDEPNGISLAQSKINYQTIISKIQDAGRIVTCIAPRPRDITASGLTMTAAQYRKHEARRDWVMGLHNPDNALLCVDMSRYLANPASTNGAMKAGFSYDGVHPGLLGGYWGGLALAELFGLGRDPGLFPFVDVLIDQNTDLFHADNPNGAVNNNPMLQGGATIAVGYTAGGGSGITATASKVSPTGGRSDSQQIVLSGTATGNTDVYECHQTLPSANLTNGDVIEAYAEVEYDNMSGVAAHSLVLVNTTGFTDVASALADSTDINGIASVFPNGISGVLRTPKLTVNNNTTIRMGMKSRLINGQAVAGQYRIGSMFARKVT